MYAVGPSLNTLVNLGHNKDIEIQIQAFKMGCHQRLLGIGYKQHITNKVPAKIKTADGPKEELLKIRKRRLKCFGHPTRFERMDITILQGRATESEEVGRPRRD